MAERNALAELAERMKRKVGDFSADESFMATLGNANSPEEQKVAAFFREYEIASRIVAELAKVKINAIKENPSMVGGAFINLMVEIRAIAEKELPMPSTKPEKLKTVYIRKLKKRIAYLEEKLHAIRENTTLMERGNSCAGGGRVKQQARRIDYLEGRLLVIREIANTFGDTMCAEDGRHVGESRVKQGCVPHKRIDIGGGKLDSIAEESEVAK